jgi:hypothetical protein
MRAPHGSSCAMFVNGEAKANGDKSWGSLGSLRLFTLPRQVGSRQHVLFFENSADRKHRAILGAIISSSHLHSCMAGASCGHYGVRG